MNDTPPSRDFEIKSKSLSGLEEAVKQLAKARKKLALIKEVNRRDGVWNEHVLHSESVAEKLVKELEKKVGSSAHFFCSR